MSRRSSIGEMLRESRLSRGLSLPDVSHRLRIRRAYIEAIEEGRMKDLPGKIYALGFVRTYAEFLKLNADEVARRFKTESSHIDDSPELVFPVPAEESRIPGGAIMFVSVVLGLIAYGSWYYLSSAGRSFADLVPDVPEHLAGLLYQDGERTDAEAADPTGSRAGEAATPVIVAKIPEAPVPSMGVTTTIAGSQNAAGSQAPGVPEISSEPTAANAADGDGEATKPTAFATEPLTGPTSTTTPPAAPAIGNGAVQLAARGNITSDSSLPPQRPETADEASVATPTGRVVIKATDESWVQVRDRSRATVMTRILQPGDVYTVPDREGLTLLTGNAGGLSIQVDGVEIQSLGPSGAIRRNVPLDPDRLRQFVSDR